MKNYLLIILGMMAVTYIPRLLPLFLLTGRPLPKALKRFLLYIPYTALSALIIHGILNSDRQLLLATLAGIATAGLTAWFRGGLVLSVAASIAVAFLIQLI